MPNGLSFYTHEQNTLFIILMSFANTDEFQQNVYMILIDSFIPTVKMSYKFYKNIFT